jgi:hypothetical protein
MLLFVGFGRMGLPMAKHAGHALRSGPEHAAFEEMVRAQGLGDADRQAPRNEEGDCGPGAPASPPRGGMMSLAGRWMK